MRANAECVKFISRVLEPIFLDTRERLQAYSPYKPMGTDSTRDDLPGGVLHLLILQALSRERLHGYGIAEYIENRSGDILSIGEGTLYPTLQRLQVKGWIKAEWGVSENNRKARYYRLTPDGRKQLHSELTRYRRVFFAISRVLELEGATL